MPNTYTTAIEKKLGNDVQIIEDENGNSKVVVGKKQKEEILEKAHYSLLNLENKEKQIEGTLQGEAKQQALAKIQKEKDKLYGVLDQIGTPEEDMDYADAHLYGSIQTLGELFSEKYVGRGLDGLGVGKLASKLPGAKKLGSLYDSGKGIVNKLYSKAIGTAEDTFRHKVGSITAQALKHTGKSGQIIHSLPSEIGEEIFTQLIPNNLDNYDEQIAQLADPNFYKDIALQTLIMGGGFGAIGVAGNLKHHKNMLFNKEYAEAYKEHQNVIEATKAGYKALNKNLNNDKFAELLTQASSKGIYNLEDRMKNIISLEAEGKDKQALHIAEAGITNMMHQAVVTGTQSEFVDSLRNIVNNKESEFIPESLKQAAKNVFERKGIYEQIYNKYNSLPNFGEIYHTASDIEDSKLSINKLQQENQKHLPKVLETIEKLKEQGKIDKNFSLDFYDFNNNKKSFHEAYYGENQTGANLNTEEVKNYAKDVDTIEEALGLEDTADYFANLSGIEVAEAFNSLQTQKLREITSEEYQGRFLNKYISEQIDNIEDKKSLEELLKTAQEKGVVTPELIEQAQQRQEEIENGLPPQNRVVEKSQPITPKSQSIFDLAGVDIIPEEPLPNAATAEDFEARFNDKENRQFTPEQTQQAKEYLEELRQELKQEPTFDGFIDSFVKKFGKNETERRFNGLSQIARNIGLDTSIANVYYDRTFNSNDNPLENGGSAEDFESPEVTPEQLEKEEEKVTKEVANLDPVNITINPENGGIESSDVEFSEDEMGKVGTVKIATGTPKLAFNFTGTRDEEGNWHVDLNNLSEGYMGNRAVLDADYMYEVVKSSIEKPGSVYIELDDSRIGKISSLKEKYDAAETDEERLALTPIVIYYNNGNDEVIPISFGHDEFWYDNPHNVANEATKIQGKKFAREIRKTLKEKPNVRHAVQLSMPRGVQYNSTNKTSDKSLLPVSARNSQATIGFAKYTNLQFSYENVPEDLKLSGLNAKTDDRVRVVNIDSFEADEAGINRNNPIIFHKVGVDMNGKNLYMINTLLSPYTYESRNETEKNLGNFKLPEDLKRTFEKTLLSFIVQNYSNKTNSTEIKSVIDKVFPQNEQDNKEIKKLGTNINSLNGFIRIYNQSNSRVHEGSEKNTSAGFLKELKDLKSKGKKNTVFREFNDKGKITTEMGFWDEQAKDYRIVNLNSLTTKLLEQEGNKTFPENFEELLNNMVAAMSVVNINATSPKASSRIVTNSGIVVKQNSEVYKDILLTPLVSYEMENMKGEKTEVFNIQPVIHFNLINSEGNTVPVTSTQETTQSETEETINQPKIESTEKSELESFIERKEEFLQKLVATGLSEELALQQYNIVLKNLGANPIDFESRNNINVVQELGNEDTLKIQGITVFEQSHLISYLKNQILSSESLKKVFNKKKLTLEATQEISKGILNSLDSIRESKERLQNTEKVLQEMGVTSDANILNLISKYEKILENKDKIQTILKQEIEALNISLDDVDESELNEIDTAENFDKTNGEQNVKMAFGFSLKASLFGFTKKLKSNQEVVGLLGLPEYYTPDEILDKILGVVTSVENNFDTWLKAFENKYNSSIDNNKILYNTSVYLDIKNYLNNLSEERRNELMYNIGSLRKLTVLKYIINPQYDYITETIVDENGEKKTKKTRIISGTKLQTIDENSSKENLKIRKAIFNGFTNPTMGTFTQIKDGKLVLNKAYVKNVGRRIKELIEETNIDKKYNYKTLREIFDLMGLQEISDSTVQYISSLKLDKNNIKIYSENGLFKPFLKNLENILLDKDLDIISLSLNENNPFSNLTSLKSLIALEVDLNRNSISSAIRAGDKTLQGTLQTSSIYDITNRFLNDSEREKALEEYGKDLYTKNSIFLQVISKSEKFKSNFEIAFNSPEAMKMFGTNSGENSDIDELSNFDRLVFYMHSLTENRGNIELEKNVANDLNHSYVSSFENEHLNFRINRVPFLTLSDKGRVVLVPSIAVNLPKNEVNIVNSNLISLGDSTLNYVYNTVLKGELERIIDTYKNKSGNTYEGYAEGKNQFQSIASLNGITLEYENNGETLERNIHEVIYLEHIKNGEVSPSMLSEIETKIKEAFQEYVKEELKNKVKETSRIERKDDTVITYEGELVDSGILRSTVLLTKENKIISKENTTESGEVIKESMIKKIDTKMLSEKSGDNEVEQLQHATVEFIVNNFVTMLTNTQIFLGDPAFYHKSKVKINFDNNGKITSKSVETLKDPVKLVQLQQDIASNIQKRSASVIAPGSTLANSSGNSQYATEMIHIAVQDVEMHSLLLDAMIRNHYGTLTLQQENELEKLKKINSEIQSLKEQLDVFENDNIYKDKQASIEDRIEEASKIGIVKNEEGKTIDLFEDLRDYFKVTGTDAQEYSTWRTHLDTLFRKGDGITKEMFDNLTHKLSNNIDLTQEELNTIFQPIKPVYTGVVYDKKTNKMRPVYIKSSVFPLLPQWVKGTPLDNVRKNLESLETIRENGMIDRHVRMSYQTANKIGAKKSELTMNYLYGATPEQFKQSSLTRNAASVLPLSNWKIQQETPSKEEKYFLKGKDSRITLGSQFFKGIMGNFINHIETNSFNGIFNQHILDLAGIDKKVGEKLTGQELDKIYTKTYEKYSNILTEQLEKELNLEEISDYYSPNTTQEQKLAILKSIQKLLRKEITRKGYPSYLGDAIDIIKEDLSFRSVLMFDNNRHKFEAMLQSIIANRLIVHTLPGNSHISGSSEGFMKKKQLSDLSAEDKSNIVWLNGNATGELKATYLKDSNGEDVIDEKGEKILVEAEIAIPSHFKFYNSETNNYEYVDLTKEPYSIPIKNEQDETTGYVLNKDMISEEMLSNFGFRIPTSSHQSGTILKVAAFLPRNVGDLVLVPKEQTTQLGEDYDVDKRYMYKANYIVDETGKIRELAPEDFELFKSQELSKKGKQDLLEEELENLKIKRKDLYDQIKEDKTSDNLLKAIFGEESFQEGINEVKEELKEINAKLYLSRKINEKLRNEFEIKLLENSMINTYKAVFSSSDINVQKKIYKPLVTDVANSNAQVINKARNANRDNSNFSLFSDTYQRYLMQLGADGKGGIGVHSNGVVNLSQLQRLSEDRKLKLGWFTPSSLYQGQVIPAEFKKFEIKFNSKFLKNNFEGTVGKEVYTLDGKREVAEQPGENQNVSTDNINKGIMVLRNENSHTLSTYNMIAVMGIDQSNDTFTYTDENGQKKEMYLHIPSFFHSQPIMIDYVRLKEEYSSIDAEFLSQEQIQELVIKDLLDKYGNYSESDYNVIFQNEGFTSQLLYDLIKDPNYALQKEPTASGIVPNEVQWAILNTILGIKEQSDKMDRVRKLANLSTSKLGISYFETIAKDTTLRNLIGELKEAQQALALGEIGEYNNWLNILGNFEENEPRDLTIEGIQLLNALKISKKVLPILFNYENSNLLNGGLIDKLFKIQGKDFESVSKSSLKERYQIMSDFSNFVNSGMNAFEGNTISELARLTKDSETHRGLGYILQDLRNKRNPIMENYLLKDLELTTDPNSGVTLIKHTAQDVSTLANSNKIDAFLNLLIDDTVLGIYNGEELTVSNLAKDLVSYSILADNQNGATGFRQFIPTSYLEAIGFNQNLRNFSKKFSNEYLERMQDLFIEQYLQHNPDKIKFKDVVKGSVKLSSGIKEEDKPLYALERISKSKKRIWKYNKSTKSYEEIPLLGSANTIGEVGINEYDFNNSVRRSVYISEQQKVTPIYIKDSNTNTLIGRPNDKLENYLYTGNLNNFFRSEEMLKGDANAVKAIIDRLFGNELIDSLNPEMNAIWEVYKNYINKDLKIKFEIPTGYENVGRFDGVYRHGENTIYINPNVFRALYNDVAKESKDGKVDILKIMDKFKTLMMEEVLHSIQVSHLQKGWNTPQGKSIREKYQKALTLGITNPYLQNTGNELVDVAEFIAGIYASPELRQDLEKADKGFIDRFLYSLKRLLQELIPGKGFETIHHNMIEMVKQNFGKVNFLESQQVAQEVKEVKKELSPSEKLNEIRKDEVQVTPVKNALQNNQNFESRNNENIDESKIVYAEDPYQSEQLESQGYTYIGNRDTEMGNLPAYYKFNSDNFSNFAEEAFECK